MNMVEVEKSGRSAFSGNVSRMEIYKKAQRLFSNGMSQHDVFVNLLEEYSSNKFNRICEDIRNGKDVDSCSAKEARMIYSIVEEVFLRGKEDVEEKKAKNYYKKSFMFVAIISVLLFFVSISFIASITI